MLEEVVVTGTLVKSSLARVAQWSKLLFLLQLVLFIYRMWTNYDCSYDPSYDSSEPFGFICMFVLFGIWLPLCGYSSASARDRPCLALFACVQGIMSVVGLFDVWKTTQYQRMLRDGCKHCTPIFDRGSETCQYGIGHNNDGINIDRYMCQHFPTLGEIACRAFMMTSISCAGCCAALSARQMLNDNHVVAQIMELVPEIMELVPEVEVEPEVIRNDPSGHEHLEHDSRANPPVLVAGRVEEKSSEVGGGVLV